MGAEHKKHKALIRTAVLDRAVVAGIVALVLLGMSFFCCDRVVGALPPANEFRLIVGSVERSRIRISVRFRTGIQIRPCQIQDFATFSPMGKLLKSSICPPFSRYQSMSYPTSAAFIVLGIVDRSQPQPMHSSSPAVFRGPRAAPRARTRARSCVPGRTCVSR
jgi:hypothetical protein